MTFFFQSRLLGTTLSFHKKLDFFQELGNTKELVFCIWQKRSLLHPVEERKTPTTYRTSGESIELKKSEFQEIDSPHGSARVCWTFKCKCSGINSFLKMYNTVSECCQYSIITLDPWEQEPFWWELILLGWKEALPVNKPGRNPFVFLEEAAGFAWCQWSFNQKAQKYSPY